jgi:hypothetical protein
VKVNVDKVVSLLLPSVRVFVSFYSGRVGLLVACALRQAGYEHTWATLWESREEIGIEKGVLHAIVAPCQIAPFGEYEPPWAILPYGGFPDNIQWRSNS